MLNCLDSIVGVTNTENPCITGGLTSDQLLQIKKSASGLYLDDLPGGVHMRALQKVDQTKSFYEMTQAALRVAATTLENDLITSLNKEYKKNRNNYIGPLGLMSFAANLPTSGQFQGLRLRPVDYSDAVVKVDRVTIIVSQTANFYVYLYRAKVGTTTAELVNSWAVSVIGNAWQFITPTDPLLLPSVVDGELMDYFFLWDRAEASAANPKDNKIMCSTCPGSSGVKVSDYINAQGFQSNTFPDIQNLTLDNYAHGLVLDVTIKCDTEKLFCGQYDANDAVALCMAYAVQFKAGELLIEDILKTPDINRYTTMDKERLWGKRNHFRKEYEGRITFLTATLDVGASNCYVCRDQVNQPFTAAIFI